MGHLLGMSHDSEVCSCASARCIMHPGALNSHGWSDCSKEYFAKFKAVKQNIDCLRQMPSKQFVPTKCGNKIVDSGEECDCGSPIECTKVHPFCDPRTCKLRRNFHNECQLPSHCNGVHKL